MVPTEAAKRLQGPLDEAFGIINLAMQQHAHFDPSTADRVFRMSMSDMSEFYCLPPLLAALENTASGVRFEIVQLSAESVGAAMRAGEIDLTFGYVPGLEEGCVSERLFLDEYVCLVRAGHPLKARKASKEDLMGLRYLYASTNATGHYMIDQWMRDLGIPRQIVVRVPHFIVAPEVLRNTDLAAIFPRSIAEQFNRGRAFRLLTLPFELPPIEVSLHTHVRFASDPGIRWLRETLLTIFSRG
jgi:DNA-binding transcriptional LysR family regulator